MFSILDPYYHPNNPYTKIPIGSKIVSEIAPHHYSAMIFTVKHDSFVDLNIIDIETKLKNPKLIIDGWLIFQKFSNSLKNYRGVSL